MRVYVKEPGKRPKLYKDAEVTLEWLQKQVGGYIETYPLGPGSVIVCNDSGKLIDLPFNFTLLDGRGGTINRTEDFVGTVVFLGLKHTDDGMDFTDFDKDLPLFINTLAIK